MAESISDNYKCNIPTKIWNLRKKKLHNQKNHPIEIIKKHIYNYFGDDYIKYDDLNEEVPIEDNFDKLLICKDHPCRSKSDTYYIDEKNVLRTQTSCHQSSLLEKMIHELDTPLAKSRKFLVTGDVYRKDEIDKTHYPVFHQMEGLCIVNDDTDPEKELKQILIGLVNYLFPGCQYRMNDDYFPFTNPSWEIEVDYKGNWLEILGCGITQTKILENTGHVGRRAWAFGLGLERLAMILFKIPDIRIFWSNDQKFLSQYDDGQIKIFKEYSKLEPTIQDISLWIKDEDLIKNNECLARSSWLKQNDFYDYIRSLDTNDMIESIERFDSFYHPYKKMLSHAYHITYSCPNTKITDPAILTKMSIDLHKSIYAEINEKLNVEHR
jgi:phenylalanyl-tRNA synthetase alpha chain